MLREEDKKDEKEEGEGIINYSNKSEIQMVLFNKHFVISVKIISFELPKQIWIFSVFRRKPIDEIMRYRIISKCPYRSITDEKLKTINTEISRGEFFNAAHRI